MAREKTATTRSILLRTMIDWKTIISNAHASVDKKVEADVRKHGKHP
jgi:hypothetical protein